MEGQSQQLVRLAELLNVSAGLLRYLVEARDLDGQAAPLRNVAEDLERLADRVREVGLSFPAP